MIVLGSDEAILFDGKVKYNGDKVLLTLTSKRMIFEKVVGMFKKTLQIVDEVLLEDIILYKNKVQIKERKKKLKIQTTNKRIIIVCDSITDAMKIKENIITLRTGHSIVERAGNNIIKKVGTFSIVAGTGALLTSELKSGFKNSKLIIKNLKVISKDVIKGGKSLVKTFFKK